MNSPKAICAALGLLCAPLCAGWFGCGADTRGSNGGDGDAGGADDASGRLDAHAPLDAGDQDAGPPDRVGAIFAFSDSWTVDGGVRGVHSAGASFIHTRRPATTTKATTVGPCLVETVSDGSPADEERLSAGALRLAGAAKAIDLSPNSDGTYAPSTGSTPLWTGGETLTVRGDGKGDIPPFTIQLTAPSKITLASPKPSGGSFAVTRSAGFSATFTGGSSGVVVLSFDAATATSAHIATCTFDVASGSAVVPPAALAGFPAADGTFDFYVKQADKVRSNGWEVRFTASSALVDSTGAQALQGVATFQ